MLALARAAIQHGLEHSAPLTIHAADYAPKLQAKRCCFVTLHKHGELRGCIGALQATAPLIEDVAEHAYAAAFQDSRFPPLRTEELAALTISISVLSPQQPLSFNSEEDLLAQINVGTDGISLEDGTHRATYLPSVWEQLPDKWDFWRQLKRKAGLNPNHWSSSLRVFRYHTVSFGEH